MNIQGWIIGGIPLLIVLGWGLLKSLKRHHMTPEQREQKDREFRREEWRRGTGV